ncbi:hypothetical protein ABTX82_01620 [Streptomyces lavendulae]|uniref:hypothetical protein n=1 Tax=Streptomyces lavendulae TaxID=1914 RepID=UPI00332C2324
MIDRPRLTPNPDGGVILHLPNITYLDTQAWSVDVGLTNADLAALRTALAISDIQLGAAHRRAVRLVERIGDARAWARQHLTPEQQTGLLGVLRGGQPKETSDA